MALKRRAPAASPPKKKLKRRSYTLTTNKVMFNIWMDRDVKEVLQKWIEVVGVKSLSEYMRDATMERYRRELLVRLEERDNSPD